MTKEQCRTCTQPTKHCQDEQFQHLENCSCLNYITQEQGVNHAIIPYQ